MPRSAGVAAPYAGGMTKPARDRPAGRSPTRTLAVGDALPAIDLVDADGNDVSLADACGDGPALIQVIRYYGCMPCQDYLLQLRDRRPDLDALGVAVVAVAGAADFQARWLRDEKGVSFELLLDPDHRVREVLGMGRIAWWRYLLPTTWWKYLRAARRGRQGRISRPDAAMTPGLAIVDKGVVRHIHRRVTLGDLPSVDDVLAHLRRLAW